MIWCGETESGREHFENIYDNSSQSPGICIKNVPIALCDRGHVTEVLLLMRLL